MRRIFLYLYTLIHLKPSQIIWKLVRKIQKIFISPPKLVEASYLATSLNKNWVLNIIPCYLILNLNESDYLKGVYKYAGISKQFSGFPDWNKQVVNPLWTYELHYFKEFPHLAYLYTNSKNPVVLNRIKTTLLDWQEKVSVKCVAWDPYPLSTRIINWALTALLLKDEFESDRKFYSIFIKSLTAQVQYLENRLEFHLLGNHLFRNLAALIFVKIYLGKLQLKREMRLLNREIKAQIKTDGSHYEESPSYHLLVLRDLLLMIQSLKQVQQDIPDFYLEKLGLMNRYLQKIWISGIGFPLFNDTLRVPEVSYEAIQKLFEETRGHQIEPKKLNEGYFDYKSKEEILFVDAGLPGPTFLQGHAHCDLLSYEYFYKGHPVIIDSGVHGYNQSVYRAYSRSTAAHNTIRINGLEQFEIWDCFRVARQPKNISGKVFERNGNWHFIGEYSPYHDRSLIHERNILRLSEGEWDIKDKIVGKPAQIESFVHVAPEWKKINQVSNKIQFKKDGLVLDIMPYNLKLKEVYYGETEPIQGWHFPYFGKAIKSLALVFEQKVNPEEKFGYCIKCYESN